jgi:hypothetical protein
MTTIKKPQALTARLAASGGAALALTCLAALAFSFQVF